MSKMSTTEMTSYAGGVTAIGSALTLTQFGVIVGIVTALLTFAMNMYFSYRKDKREEQERFDAREQAQLTKREIEARIKVLEIQSVPKS